MAGDSRKISVVICGIELIERFARFRKEGTGISLIGKTGGIGRYKQMIPAVRSKIHIGSLIAAVCHGIGHIILRSTAGSSVQQLRPCRVRLGFMQCVMYSVGLRRMRTPVSEHIMILCDRHIQRSICRFVSCFHIKPAAEGIPETGSIGRVIHRTENISVDDLPCFEKTTFVPGRFIGDHIVICAEESYRMGNRSPFCIQSGVFCRHSVPCFIFAAVIAAGGIVPAAEGICIFFKGCRIRRRNATVIIKTHLVRNRVLLQNLIVVMQSQVIALSGIEKPRRIGLTPVVQCSVGDPLFTISRKAMQRRLGLIGYCGIVIRSIDRLIQLVTYAVIGQVGGFPRKDRHIQFIDPLSRNTPTNIGSVIEKRKEVDDVGGSFGGIVQERIPQFLEHTLYCRIGIIFGIFHLELAVPAGKIGIVSPFSIAHI